MRTVIRTPLLVLSLVVTFACAIAAGRGDSPASTEHVLTLAVPGRSNATPSMAADGRFMAIVWGGTTADGKTDVFIATSRNGGLTFGAPVQVNTEPGEARLSGEMPPRVAILKTASYGGPDVVVLWTARGASTSIKLARSPNGGRTFEEPIVMQTAGAAGDRGWPAMTVDAKGMAHAVWLDHRGMAAEHHHAASGAPRDPVAMAQKSGLYYANVMVEPPAEKSASSADRELAKGVCYCCKTSLIAGRDGALYAAWRHVYPGSERDIAFSVSRDGGKSFSAPTPISKDHWAIDACPDDGPTMAVASAGDGGQAQRVHIVWPTVIDASGNANGSDPRGALFYTSTTDGRSFASRTRIPTLGSAKASHPQVTIDHAGRVFVAWDETIKGKRVVAVREIKPGAGAAAEPATSFGPPITLTDDAAPGFYPVVAATSDSLIAAWTSPAATAPNASTSTTSTITVARVRTGYANAGTGTP